MLLLGKVKQDHKNLRCPSSEEHCPFRIMQRQTLAIILRTNSVCEITILWTPTSASCVI